MNKISIGIGNFYYYNYNLLECLNYLKKIDNISGIEIVVKHNYKFSKKELELLNEYNFNTLHLLGYTKNDLNWMKYCIKIIPNFKHFVLHPDSVNLNEIGKDIEKYISFENMDIRKSSHQTPEEMIKLFKQHPESKFTFDINHAEENNIDFKNFESVKFPSQIHFSVVNKNYYRNNPEIQTSHALSCLEKGFNFDLKKYKNCIITLEGVFIPNKPELIKKEINLVEKLLQNS